MGLARGGTGLQAEGRRGSSTSACRGGGQREAWRNGDALSRFAPWPLGAGRACPGGAQGAMARPWPSLPARRRQVTPTGPRPAIPPLPYKAPRPPARRLRRPVPVPPGRHWQGDRRLCVRAGLRAHERLGMARRRWPRGADIFTPGRNGARFQLAHMPREQHPWRAGHASLAPFSLRGHMILAGSRLPAHSSISSCAILSASSR